MMSSNSPDIPVICFIFICGVKKLLFICVLYELLRWPSFTSTHLPVSCVLDNRLLKWGFHSFVSNDLPDITSPPPTQFIYQPTRYILSQLVSYLSSHLISSQCKACSWDLGKVPQMFMMPFMTNGKLTVITRKQILGWGFIGSECF